MTAIDVIIPAHNEEHLIGLTLESIAAQRLGGDIFLQVLVVANNCSDNTVAVARAAIKHLAGRPDMAFKVVAREPVAKTAGINYALAHTKAPLVFCVDADVTFSPDCFAKVAADLARPGIKLSGGEPYDVISDELKGTFLGQLYRVRQLKKAVVGGMIFPFGRFMAWHRGAISAFPTDFRGADNVWLAFEVARQFGWKAVSMAPDTQVWAQPPQNWVDFVRQESRWKLNFANLPERKPELKPVAAEFRKLRAKRQPFTPDQHTKLLELMDAEKIAPSVLEFYELMPRLMRDNAGLMRLQLTGPDGNWKAIDSTKAYSGTGNV